MDELTIGDKIYISSKQAAKITGYAKDYVGQLCREGRVDARLVGRNWYVLESSIREHRFGAVSTPEAPVVAAEEPEMSPVRAWEAPTYEAVKEEIILPPLEAPKTPAQKPDTAEAVALMQDAWKEWFATREQAQVVVAETESVKDPIEEVEMIEEELDTPVRVSDIPSNEATYETFEVDEEESTIPVTRVEEREVFEDYEPVVTHVQTPMTVRSAPIDLRNASGVIDLSQRHEEVVYQPVRPVVRSQVRKVRKSSNLTTQAILVSFAGLAIVVAVIGSGVLDSALATPGIGDGLRGSVIDVIRGESTVNK